METSDIEAHDETAKAELDDVTVMVWCSVKEEGSSAGTLLGVVSRVVTEAVKWFENVGKSTAATALSHGECHSSILSPVDSV